MKTFNHLEEENTKKSDNFNVFLTDYCFEEKNNLSGHFVSRLGFLKYLLESEIFTIMIMLK